MDYIETLIHLYELLPSYWCLYLLFVFFISYIVFYRFDRGDGIAIKSFLAQYILFILFMTIIGRTKVLKRAEFMPFWSYFRPKLWPEILLNYILFIPFGFLLFSSYGVKNEIRKRGINTKRCVLIGFLISTLIEINQFIFSIGLFEFDDIIGNTLGCYIGVMISRRVVISIRERRNLHKNERNVERSNYN